MLLISRKEAAAKGLTRYFTGRPCPRGHLLPRFVSTHGCVGCVKANKNSEKGRTSEKAGKRRRYAADPTKALESVQKWVRANRDKSAAIKRRWSLMNPEKVKSSRAAYNRRNPEKILGYFRRRHARLKASVGTHTFDQVTALLEAQEFRCNNPFCGADLRLVKKHLDHIQPLTPVDGGAPGSSGIGNLQWLCAPCNKSKGNKDWSAWLADCAKRSARR